MIENMFVIHQHDILCFKFRWEHHQTIKKINMGHSKMTSCIFGDFQTPSCHAKTISSYTCIHSVTKASTPYPKVTWRHLWKLPKINLQLRECLERHCFPEACWQSGYVLVELPDAVECSQAHSEKEVSVWIAEKHQNDCIIFKILKFCQVRKMYT